MHLANGFQEKGYQPDFELTPLEYNTGLFNNVDTLSPFTDSSVYTNDTAYLQTGDTVMTTL